jgi:hypothetical protein
MSLASPAVRNITPGTVFTKWDTVMDQLIDWALNRGESFQVKRNETGDKCKLKRIQLACQLRHGCTFNLLVSESKKDGSIQCASYKPHQCPPITHDRWSYGAGAQVVARHQRELILSNLNITAKAISAAEKATWGHDIQLQQAYRARQVIKGEAISTTATTFQFITPFLKELAKDSGGKNFNNENGAYTDFEIADDGTFLSAFIAPTPCRQASKYCRKFFAMDGCHMKKDDRYTLLILVGLDAGEQIILLAYGLVLGNETRVGWTWFLQHCLTCFNRLAEDDVALISDRAKGLIPAVEELVPKAHHYHCCKHILDNVKAQHGMKAWHSFGMILRLETDAQITDGFNDIAIEVGGAAFEYCDALPKDRYLKPYCPLERYPRYGQTCSNIAESTNNWMEVNNPVRPTHMCHHPSDAAHLHFSLLKSCASSLFPDHLIRYLGIHPILYAHLEVFELVNSIVRRYEVSKCSVSLSKPNSANFRIRKSESCLLPKHFMAYGLHKWRNFRRVGDRLTFILLYMMLPGSSSMRKPCDRGTYMQLSQHPPQVWSFATPAQSNLL